MTSSDSVDYWYDECEVGKCAASSVEVVARASSSFREHVAGEVQDQADCPCVDGDDDVEAVDHASYVDADASCAVVLARRIHRRTDLADVEGDRPDASYAEVVGLEDHRSALVGAIAVVAFVVGVVVIAYRRQVEVEYRSERASDCHSHLSLYLMGYHLEHSVE